MDKLNNLISSRFFDDISSIITTGQRQAYAAAGQAAIATYWNIGRRIVEEEQQGAVYIQRERPLFLKISSPITFHFK